jgi:hypothetical protein
VTVKGTLVCRTASPFAGRCQKSGLGRSVFRRAGFLPDSTARRRHRVSLGRRGGERHRACSSSSACTLRENTRLSRPGKRRPSLGPRTRARQLPRLRRRKSMVVARSIRYRGRANPRKREEPTPGSGGTDGARLAVRLCSRKESTGRIRKGRRSRPSSLRGLRARVSARTSFSFVAEVGRRRGLK